MPLLLEHDPRPGWSREPFYRFFEYLQTELRLLHLARHGIGALIGLQKAVEVLYDPESLGATEIPQNEREARLLEAREAANLAQAEVDADFPLLHAHSIIGIWGALESLVHEVLRDWLRHRPSLLKSEPFTSVRVPLADFQRMKSAERIDHLLEAVRPQSAGGGFLRLEAWLSCVGLAGPLDDAVRRDLIESWEVRNVYAHRRGIADKKARVNCPWRRREWKLGQQIIVTHDDYGRYTNAIHQYAFELICRSGAKFGVDVRDYSERVLRAQEEGLIEFVGASRNWTLTEAGRRLKESGGPDG